MIALKLHETSISSIKNPADFLVESLSDASLRNCIKTLFSRVNHVCKEVFVLFIVDNFINEAPNGVDEFTNFMLQNETAGKLAGISSTIEVVTKVENAA